MYLSFPEDLIDTLTIVEMTSPSGSVRRLTAIKECEEANQTISPKDVSSYLTQLKVWLN